MYSITLDGLKTRFGEQVLIRLTDDAGVGVIDEAKVTAAITAVDGKISSYLRDTYTLPLAVVDPELTTAGEDLALERIYSNKPERETPKDVKDRAKEATDWLLNIKKGLASLSISRPATAVNDTKTGSGFIRASKTKADRIFSDDKLDTFFR